MALGRTLVRIDPNQSFVIAVDVVVLAVNVTAALLFVFKAPVDWPIAGAMAVGAFFGGTIGGRIASRVKPGLLRAVAASVGFVAAAYYFVTLAR